MATVLRSALAAVIGCSLSTAAAALPKDVAEVVQHAKIPAHSASRRFLTKAEYDQLIDRDSATAAKSPAAVSSKAPPAVAAYDWTGAYLGGHFGYGMDSFGPVTNPGFVGGFQAGYNFQLPNNVVLGLDADLSFPSPIDRPVTGRAPFNTAFDYFGTARPRIGYAFGSFLPYLAGGAAWGQTKVNINDTDGNLIASKSATHVGWSAGAGIEYALMGNWTAKVEYNYVDLGPKTYGLDIAAQPTRTVDPKVHIVELGLNYRLWDISPWASPNSLALKKTPVPESDDWSIHGQSTFIEQGYPPIRSPYQGANSLPGGGQGRETWTATAFIGRRLWDGGEIYFNPELAQGFGLAGTLGLGGFSNGEAQKAGGEFPKVRAQRYFFSQTFGLGGEQETVDDGANQLAGKRDIDRVTVTVGRFAVGDFFDKNAYAHDPRADFMNWAMWSSAAYDFPADLPGFTRGAVVELNRKDWALRAGWFQVPEQPNSDVLVFRTGGAIVELEEPYTIFSQPGTFRLGAFANQGRTGNYREALAIASADPSANINTAMLSTRQDRPKDGIYVNAEQAITKDIGVFARASWNDGQNEILSFTDVDSSLSGGLSIKGSAWGRANDTFGVGGAINGLSGPHRDFLAAGGLGLLIGDGQLNYSEEKILEQYYAVSLAKWATLTFDYQFIVDPAYNADRGPVSIFSTRLHAEF
jgi:high affinity Mn2+ porin